MKQIYLTRQQFWNNFFLMFNETRGEKINEIVFFEDKTGKEILRSSQYEHKELLRGVVEKGFKIKNKMIRKNAPDWTLDAFAMRSDIGSVDLYINAKWAKLRAIAIRQSYSRYEKIYYSETLDFNFKKHLFFVNEKSDEYKHNEITTTIKKIDHSTFDMLKTKELTELLLDQINKYFEMITQERFDNANKVEELWETLNDEQYF